MPQGSLIMRRSSLTNLPAGPTMIDGGLLRRATGYDREGLLHLLLLAFPEIGWDMVRVEEAFYTDPNVSATFVIEREGQLIATASSLFEPSLSPQTGTLHWVAAHPHQSGKGLGALVSLAVLEEFVQQGRHDALLRTDDSRLAAITTYLRLGFLPDRTLPDHDERWAQVFQLLAERPRKS